MPYLYLDDNFADHPKVDALSDAAFRLHVSGLLYCAKHKTDGYIPAERVPRLVPRYKKASLTELIRGRLWLPDDAALNIHDYLDWNRSRQQIEEDQERVRKQRSEAGKKGAAARWHKA
jgi:hypothetical protein